MAKKRSEEKESAMAADVANDSSSDEAQLDAEATEEETDTTQAVPAELSAIHTDNVVAKEASEGKVKAKSVKADSKPAKERVRSARYLKAFGAVDSDKSYGLKQALELVQQTSYSTFPGSVELHARLMTKKGKAVEAVRGLVQLPHGTGKTINAAILTEEIIAEIAKTKSTTYDVLIAPKTLMPKVASIAKILGPLGKMPSPKAGTVADKPEETLAAIQSGRTEYRSDSSGNIHLTVGKANWDVQKLLDNADAAAHTLPRNQLQSLTLSATMGPGIRVDLSSL
jgi:large subunit ribosomal protein L1